MPGLDSKKQRLIQEFKNLSAGKSSDEILPLLLAFSNKAKQEGISFTKDDLHFITEQIKDGLSEREKQLLPGLLSLMEHQ